MKRIASAVGMLVALIAAGMCVGCGQEEQQSTASHQDGSVLVAQPASIETPQTSGTPVSSGAPVATSKAPADGVMPPEVEVVAPDEPVEHGQVVGLFAYGSDDVVEIVLGDDRGEQQAFTYDESGKRWQTLYRVPLKSKDGKIGLSVTARNESGRWRRVWAFLSTQPLATSESASTPVEGTEPASPDSLNH